MSDKAAWAELWRQGVQLANRMLQLAAEDPDFVRSFDRDGGIGDMSWAELHETIVMMNGFASRKLNGLDAD